MAGQFGIVLLAGGEARRMGTRKESLCLNGRTLAQKIVEELSLLGLPMAVSVRNGQKDGFPSQLPRIPDRYENQEGRGVGPIGGILSCLEETGWEGAVFVACDMPMLQKRQAERLLEAWEPSVPAVLWKTRDGRLQPLCGLYTRACIPMLRLAIEEGRFGLTRLFEKSCRILETKQEDIPDLCFCNLNNREEYEQFLNAAKQPAFMSKQRSGLQMSDLLCESEK